MNLSEEDIKFLITKCKEIFVDQSILLDLEAPISIVGNEIIFNF